ncbi:MAG: hypothetical protein ACHQF0_08710 [Chitinophagales bacterium]
MNKLSTDTSLLVIEKKRSGEMIRLSKEQKIDERKQYPEEKQNREMENGKKPGTTAAYK